MVIEWNVTLLFSSCFSGPVSNHIIIELPVNEASLEVVSKGGDFFLMLSRIAGIVLLKLRQK